MATSEETCCKDMDNILLAQRSPMLELKAIANAVRKTVRTYRLKFFWQTSCNCGSRKWSWFCEIVKSLYYSFDFCNIFCYIMYFIFNIVFRSIGIGVLNLNQKWPWWNCKKLQQLRWITNIKWNGWSGGIHLRWHAKLCIFNLQIL